MTSSEIWQVREISLKYANVERRYNHGLKHGMHFFSSQKVKQTEYNMYAVEIKKLQQWI